MNLVSKFLTRFIKGSKGESRIVSSSIRGHKVIPLASQHISLINIHNTATGNAVTRRMAGKSLVKTRQKSRALRFVK